MITGLATKTTLRLLTNSQRRFAPTSRTAVLRRIKCHFASESVPISSEYSTTARRSFEISDPTRRRFVSLPTPGPPKILQICSRTLLSAEDQGVSSIAVGSGDLKAVEVSTSRRGRYRSHSHKRKNRQKDFGEKIRYRASVLYQPQRYGLQLAASHSKGLWRRI
jgi:hypothetical protein